MQIESNRRNEDLTQIGKKSTVAAVTILTRCGEFKLYQTHIFCAEMLLQILCVLTTLSEKMH